MTIEISLDDLLYLTEVARSNGHSVLYATRTTDGKRAALVITAQPRRKRPAPPRVAAKVQAPAKAD
jgi:hypothetical protein